MTRNQNIIGFPTKTGEPNFPNDFGQPMELKFWRAGLSVVVIYASFPSRSTPTAGTLIAFKRSDNSWHGHEPFEGERRVIQFNWLTSEGNRQIAMLRHHTSAAFKRVLQTLRPGHA